MYREALERRRPALFTDFRESTSGAEPKIPNVSHQLRCIFIHIPKAAGTSIKTIFDMMTHGHYTWAYYSICYPETWQEYTSFAVVRNPWDRVVSAYHSARMRESFWHHAQLLPLDYPLLLHKSFEECLTILCDQRHRLKSVYWHPQISWIATPKSVGGNVMVDRVLRFESLDTDFPRLCADLGIEPRSLPKINPSDRARGYRQYYNDTTRRLVERIYASDIEAFDYSF